MAAMNAHSLFLGSRQVPAYHQAIAPCPKAHARLVAADKKVRAALRAAAGEVERSATRLAALATRRFFKDHGTPAFDVRFLWQGSKVYKTDIDPAIKPPQQSDLDDGVYLRTSFFNRTDPAIACQRFFQFVQDALQPLCDAEGWTLIKDKNTCVRIVISGDLHLDLPLYAIPDEEFSSLQAAAMRTFGENIMQDGKNILLMMDQERSLRIDPERVMLAHRTAGWIASDPRALHDWFEAKAEQFGPQLKRICRYYKGWRDFVFENGGPESITLMACVVIVFEDVSSELDETRDDKAFLAVASRLPDLFRGDIRNPVLPGQDAKLNGWSDAERSRYIAAAEALYNTATTALNGTRHPDITVNRFIEALGDRFPMRPDLVKLETPAETVSGASAIILPGAFKPAQSTTSG
ncbi:MAG: hypothetical protein KL801_15515 [Mesorhizobium sp.]|nr:hypothetical protein [Mesorhizobium sp.]